MTFTARTARCSPAASNSPKNHIMWRVRCGRPIFATPTAICLRSSDQNAAHLRLWDEWIRLTLLLSCTRFSQVPDSTLTPAAFCGKSEAGECEGARGVVEARAAEAWAACI